jgi:hypothetical protein
LDIVYPYVFGGSARDLVRKLGPGGSAHNERRATKFRQTSFYFNRLHMTPVAMTATFGRKFDHAQMVAITAGAVRRAARMV